jgi:hypothetical protein
MDAVLAPQVSALVLHGQCSHLVPVTDVHVTELRKIRAAPEVRRYWRDVEASDSSSRDQDGGGEQDRDPRGPRGRRCRESADGGDERGPADRCRPIPVRQADELLRVTDQRGREASDRWWLALLGLPILCCAGTTLMRRSSGRPAPPHAQAQLRLALRGLDVPSG